MKFERNPKEKKKAILETAEDFFYKKGYEKTSVNMIIEKLKISKGAFYHHFKSKISLLDSVAEFVIKKELDSYNPIFTDQNLNALEKFNKIFNISKRWKLRSGKFFKSMMKSLFTDDNITLRRKFFRKNIELVAPKIDKLIAEGISQNIFFINQKEKLGEIIINIDYTMNEDIAFTLFNDKPKQLAFENMEKKLKIYEKIYSSLLGLKDSSVIIYDEKTLKKLFNI